MKRKFRTFHSYRSIFIKANSIGNIGELMNISENFRIMYNILTTKLLEMSSREIFERKSFSSCKKNLNSYFCLHFLYNFTEMFLLVQCSPISKHCVLHREKN
jgi:hypothetical protein